MCTYFRVCWYESILWYDIHVLRSSLSESCSINEELVLSYTCPIPRNRQTNKQTTNSKQMSGYPCISNLNALIISQNLIILQLICNNISHRNTARTEPVVFLMNTCVGKLRHEPCASDFGFDYSFSIELTYLHTGIESHLERKKQPAFLAKHPNTIKYIFLSTSFHWNNWFEL